MDAILVGSAITLVYLSSDQSILPECFVIIAET